MIETLYRSCEGRDKIGGDKRQHRQLVKHGQICARMTAQINFFEPTFHAQLWMKETKPVLFSLLKMFNNTGCDYI